MQHYEQKDQDREYQNDQGHDPVDHHKMKEGFPVVLMPQKGHCDHISHHIQKSGVNHH